MAKEIWILRDTSAKGKKEEIIGFTDTAIDMFNYMWDFIEEFCTEDSKKFQEKLFNSFKKNRDFFGVENFLFAERFENLIGS